MTANTGVDLAVACQAIEYDNVRLDTFDEDRSWQEAPSFKIVNELGDVVLAGYDVFAIQQNGNASPRRAPANELVYHSTYAAALSKQ
jgi:hypothetical protein